MDKGDGVDCGGVEHVGTKNRLVNVLMKVLSFFLNKFGQFIYELGLLF